MLLASTYRNSSSRFCNFPKLSNPQICKNKVRSVDSQTRVETQNRQTDGHTRPTTVHCPLTRSVISWQEYWFLTSIIRLPVVAGIHWPWYDLGLSSYIMHRQNALFEHYWVLIRPSCSQESSLYNAETECPLWALLGTDTPILFLRMVSIVNSLWAHFPIICREPSLLLLRDAMVVIQKARQLVSVQILYNCRIKLPCHLRFLPRDTMHPRY